MSILSIRDIHKSFGTLEVLKGIDTDIARGEMVSIVGASGAGKTTLLQVMGTLLRPDEGTITLGDTDVTRLSDTALSRFRNRHIGFIFQFHQLLPEFTALENVMLPALIAGESKRAATARAAELLEFMGLSARAEHKPAELSGGEQQRVAAARALTNRPDIVFADEPTAALDVAAAATVLDWLAELAGGPGAVPGAVPAPAGPSSPVHQPATVLMVTHDAAAAARAQHVLVMDAGRLVASLPGGDPAAVSAAVLSARGAGGLR